MIELTFDATNSGTFAIVFTIAYIPVYYVCGNLLLLRKAQANSQK